MNGKDSEFIHLVECPRDAMQGWKSFIPTSKKIEYINSLIQVGFQTIDFGSFVSAKAVPQMADTKEVLNGLILSEKTQLLAIVANLRGAEEACNFEEIDCIGYPFSVSETFQLRNANSTPELSFKTVKAIHDRCLVSGKQLVVYLSMAFGNPYGDAYSKEIVFDWARKMADLPIPVLSLADTVGLATAAQVHEITSHLITLLPLTEIGVHLHSSPFNRPEKMAAAYNAGCRRFDGALKGIGGCPMAGDNLVGNMDTEWMIQWFRERNILPLLNPEALHQSLLIANEIFSR
ncbi:MAG TPA: hydroxymethylglutaryl-CoA lyase [Flavitalea sp.]|nr:hydroxymethylglutaryl-CoA lyase [Flavitalea sp.]